MTLDSFIRDLLKIDDRFKINDISTDSVSKRIDIKVELVDKSSIIIGDERFKIYDFAPQREIQHLPWFEYSCYLQINLPRYIDSKTHKKVTYTPFFCCPK
jgi:transposase